MLFNIKMKTHLFLAFLTILLASGCTKRITLNGNALFNKLYKGSVKSIKETWYEIEEKSSEVVVKSALGYTTTYFDKKGNKIKIIFNLNSTSFLDENGTLPPGIFGIKMDTLSFHGKNIFEYDRKGKLINEKHYTSKDSLDYQVVYTYKLDNKRKVLKKKSHQSDGSFEWQVYDKKGNLIKKSLFYSDSTLGTEWKYTYDRRGHLLEENITNTIFSPKTTFQYNEKGKVSLENYYNDDNSLSSMINYKYDKQGNKIVVNHFNSNGSLDRQETFKYEYDKMKNIIKEIQYTDKKPEIMISRELEYYF